jgi:choline monooxygenase
VCTHRGTTLINEPCSLREIKCPYHGRRFSLDGRCIHMPEFTEVEGFPSASDNLSPLPHFALGPLLFARIHAHPGGAELMVQDSLVTLPDDVLSMFAPLHLERCILRPSATRTFEINAHWALYVENYLEGFHVPFVHGGLNAVLDYGAYETRLYEGGVLQVGIGKPGEQRFDELPGNIVALYYWMFPNTMINVYPWGISLNVVEPAGLHRTLVHYRVYVMDEGKVGQGAGADLDRVELEDDAIVESVHRGMRSRIYHRGRYSPTRETGVHHFHRLLFP